MYIELGIAVFGFLLSFLLFCKTRMLSSHGKPEQSHMVSIIIPARNEEKSLPLLLGDLKRQETKFLEITCVDDASTDGTSGIAAENGVTLIRLDDKPSGWNGKAYACQRGADAASGSVLLFLDADVRLSPAALATLLGIYEKTGDVISVQPFHRMERLYEQLSLFFNCIQIAATGLGLPSDTASVGLFGPVILIRKADFISVGGYTEAKGSITEDLALGQALMKYGKGCRLYLGGDAFSFRMYGGGLTSLLGGWTKNIASGALKTRPLLLLAVFLWMAACISAPYHLILLAFRPISPLFVVYAVLYTLWAAALWKITRPIGNFSALTVVFYPVALLAFVGVFVVSLFKKIFGLRVTWKDRKLSPED